jgi:glutamate racemase
MPTLGVFDSGFGGLTVLRALLPLVPGSHCIYLGDTARLPYGAKSQSTVARYAVESARFLHSQGAELLVIACNTATALALEEIRAAVPIPVIGVIEPGAQAALHSLADRPTTTNLSSRPQDLSSRPKAAHLAAAVERPAASSEQPTEVLVLATAATVQSHAYRRECAALNLHATEFACPLLVPLAEEGWTDHPVTREVLRIYLAEALQQSQPQAVLLGCTHYPLLATPIQQTLHELGSQPIIIDSANATAQAVAAAIGSHPTTAALTTPPSPNSIPATFNCYATDSVEKFQRLGSHFLGQPIPQVHLLDLGG